MKLTQIIALFSGFTVMLVQGSLYIYGTMTPYIISYLHYQGDTSLTISDLSIILTLAVLFTNVGIFASNFKILSFANRTTSLISSLGIALSTFLLSYSSQFIFFIILYGMVYGFFIGYGYMAPLKNCYDHLPKRKGLCSGTCLMGFGLGAFFFNFIVVALVNPDNIPQNTEHLFPAQIGNNMPNAFKIMSIIYACIGVAGSFLIFPPKPQQEQIPILQINIFTALQMNELGEESHCSKRALIVANQHKLFYLTIMLAATVPYGLFVAFNYKEYGLYYISDDHYLSILGSIGSVGNGVFRMFWGIMMDILTFRQIKLIVISVLMASAATIYYSVQNQASYLITILLTYGCYGGLYSIYPTQTLRILGRHVGPKLYYLTFLGFSTGGIIQYISHKFLVQKYKQDGYVYCFMIFGAMLICSLIMVLRIEFSLDRNQIKHHKYLKDESVIQNDQ